MYVKLYLKSTEIGLKFCPISHVHLIIFFLSIYFFLLICCPQQFSPVERKPVHFLLLQYPGLRILELNGLSHYLYHEKTNKQTHENYIVG